MNIEKTIVIIKPDIPLSQFWNKKPIKQEKFRKIFERIIRDKYKIEHIINWLNEDIAKKHYEEKSNHPLYKKAVEYISDKTSVILSISWENAILEIRKIALKMREKYIGNNSKLYNLIHASDSIHESNREHLLHLGDKKKQS